MCSLLSHVRLFATPWTVARQALLSMEFSRQEYWSELPFPPPGDLPNPGIKPASAVSPELAGEFFTSQATGEATLSTFKPPKYLYANSCRHCSRRWRWAAVNNTAEKLLLSLSISLLHFTCFLSQNHIPALYVLACTLNSFALLLCHCIHLSVSYLLTGKLCFKVKHKGRLLTPVFGGYSFTQQFYLFHRELHTPTLFNSFFFQLLISQKWEITWIPNIHACSVASVMSNSLPPYGL